jgi:hypothetical protein
MKETQNVTKGLKSTSWWNKTENNRSTQTINQQGWMQNFLKSIYYSTKEGLKDIIQTMMDAGGLLVCYLSIGTTS